MDAENRREGHPREGERAARRCVAGRASVIGLVVVVAASVVLAFLLAGRGREAGEARRGGDHAPTVAIAGRVALPSGEPVAGAEVTLAFPTGDPSFPFSFALAYGPPTDPTGTRDAEGRFRFATVPDNPDRKAVLAVRARTKDGALYGGEVIPYSTSDPAPAVNIVVGPLDARRGDAPTVLRVTTPEGQSVPRGTVTALWARRDGGKLAVEEHREVRLVAGSAVIWPQGPFRPGAELWVLVTGAAGADDRPLPLAWTLAGPFDPRLPLAEARLELEQVVVGRVTDERGEPVVGVAVTASPEGEVVGAAGWRADRVTPTVRTDAQGRFEFRQRASVAHRISVAPPAPFLAPPPARVEPNAPPVEFRLATGARMRVRVLDSAGNPVRGAGVAFGSLGRGTTGEDGWALSPGLPPGTTALSYLFVDPPEGVETLRPERRWSVPVAEATVTLAPGRVVDVVVVDGAGRPAEGASIGGANWFQSTTDGKARLTNQPVGEFTIRASRTNGWPKTVAVPPDAKEVRVTLEGGSLRIRVPGWGEAPQEGSGGPSPALHGERPDLIRQNLPSTKYLDAEGRATFVDLDPSLTYAVRLGPLTDGRIAYAHGLKPGDAEVEIPLVPGAEIEIALAVPEGVTVRRARAYIPGYVIDGVVSDRGTLVIRGLPTGTWQVQAFARLGDRWLEKVLTAETGKRTDVDLR